MISMTNPILHNACLGDWYGYLLYFYREYNPLQSDEALVFFNKIMHEHDSVKKISSCTINALRPARAHMHPDSKPIK